MPVEKAVYILLLNWNNWKDTIECLESIFKLEYDRFKVIVCDNNSDNNSLRKIKEWANGLRVAHFLDNDQIKKVVLPYVDKPVRYIEYSIEDVQKCTYDNENRKLILIQTRKNLGFAGGNNIGLKYALNCNDCDYIWLLNNDTVVDKMALKVLVDCAKTNKNSIYGSKLLSYYYPSRIQALGISFNKYWGTTKFVVNQSDISKIDFLVGASMFIPSYVLKRIGLFSEEYFLYYEEADFWKKCKNKYTFVCALDSIVYHKEGATIGASNKSKIEKSLIGDFYGIRNRILFMKKYYPNYLITVYLGLIVTIFNRIRRKQYTRVKMIFKIITNSNMTYLEYLTNFNNKKQEK